MNTRLFPCAIAAAVALISTRASLAAMLKFDLNAVTVSAVDSSNQPAIISDPNFNGTLIISKNSGTFINGVQLDAVTHTDLVTNPMTLTGISGTFAINNGYSQGGSLTLSFLNPNSSANTYTYNIPVDVVQSFLNKAVNESLSPTRFLASWSTNNSQLNTPTVSDMSITNPLGAGYFIIHDYIPGTDAGGTDSNVNIDIGVNVVTIVPEPASLLLLGSILPALVLRRKNRAK